MFQQSRQKECAGQNLLYKKMAKNSATWMDIRRVRCGKSEILEEKEVKSFIMYCEKYFQNFGLLTAGHGSPELSCSITTQKSRRFLHRTNIKKDSNLNSVVHQMFHIQLHLPLKEIRFDHSVTTHSYWLKYIMFWDLDTWSPEINSEAAVKRRYEQRSVCSYFTKDRSLRDVTCFSFFWTHKKES